MSIEILMPALSPTMSDGSLTKWLIKVGDKVIIIIKPYHKNITKTGIVKRVLTKKKYHSRGHKVMLKDNSVGRIVKLL